ncbi:hypothetical protein BDB00DRAFT_472856 [Zychaea mexicana]|uniref:uncharacterized protein n=1 Tax=Zychaea mexicana TaxID=64656 RepID=UPI0022FDED83|nr:uncharacterized protein BDB00DRAFT_472856 [Zychaea mexicana]KAI9491792.1 hypothetical protein BDB00DRAFT_472856 [Zychaea mexicana]
MVIMPGNIEWKRLFRVVILVLRPFVALLNNLFAGVVVEDVVVVVGSSLSKEEVTRRYLNCSSKAVSSASGSDELIQLYSVTITETY